MHILTKSRQFIKTTAISASAAALLVAPGVAMAHGGSGGDDGSSHQSASHSQTHSQPQNKQSNKNANAARQARFFKARHQTCEERQTALNNRAAAFQTKYTKQLNGLNIVYSGTQTYAATVTIQDYDALKASADASQAGATNAVNAITAPQLNCDGTEDQGQADNDNNSANSTLNQQIKAAKDAVSAYQHDVFKLFNAAINS
jgi:hypothetical protein